MRSLALLSLGWLFASSHLIAAEKFTLDTFDVIPLTDVYYSEGAGAGDINGDGIADAVYGPHWYAGPDYKIAHEFYKPVPQPTEKYADHFFAWVRDFNGDGCGDILTAGFPATPGYVYENPGKDKLDQLWKKHQVADWVSNEAPQFTNLVGDDLPELVCTRDGRFGYYAVNTKAPFDTWEFHAVTGEVATKQFGHGLGIGDVNGDGRLDILHKDGWLEQPASLDGEPLWQAHAVKFASPGGAEMYACDVDGDGDNDVITSLAAHDYGLAWVEQVRDDGKVQWRSHLIMGKTKEENRYGLVFTEPHSVALADIDGDGLQDIITGKTYWSHHRKSPLWDAGAVVYWFRLVRGPDGVDWVPYRAADDTGIGREITIHDVNADGLPDIVVGGMKGGSVLIHRRKEVDQATWQAAQPKPVKAPSSGG